MVFIQASYDVVWPLNRVGVIPYIPAANGYILWM